MCVICHFEIRTKRKMNLDNPADGETSTLLEPTPSSLTTSSSYFLPRHTVHSVLRFFNNAVRHHVPEVEVDTLSPYQKFMKYRVIPCKLILNVIILSMLLANVFVYQIQRSQYEQENRMAFEAALLPTHLAPPTPFGTLFCSSQ